MRRQTHLGWLGITAILAFVFPPGAVIFGAFYVLDVARRRLGVMA